MTNEAMNGASRAGFEEAVFHAHFIKTIKHVPGRVVGTGALDLMNEGLRDRNELLARTEDDLRYRDEAIDAMWTGWSTVMAANGPWPAKLDVAGAVDHMESAHRFGFNLAATELDHRLSRLERSTEPDAYDLARDAQRLRDAGELASRQALLTRLSARSSEATAAVAQIDEERVGTTLAVDDVFFEEPETGVSEAGSGQPDEDETSAPRAVGL